MTAKHGFIKGIIFGAAIILGLIVLLFFLLPEIYLYTENSNFAQLREKSKLDCVEMPLHCMLRDGQSAEIATYIASDRDLEIRDNWGRTALFWALLNGKKAELHLLLAAGADPNTRDENDISILYQALTMGDYDSAGLLLAHGADINAFNGLRYPETALHYCVMKDKPECVGYLIQHKANLHLRDSFGYTVFERVQMHPHIGQETARLLVK